MRVVTWNIRHGLDVEGAVAVLKGDDRLRGADVLLLQEMDEVGTRALADALGCRHVYAAASVHPKTDREFGNAVLSPWTLTAGEVIELPHKARVAGQPRIAVTATVTFDQIEMTLCTTHTEIPAMGWAKRQDQYARLSQVAGEWPTEFAVLGGDFNTVTQRGTQDLIARLEAQGFAHVSIEAVNTLRRVGQDFTLDHIFAKGLMPVDSGVVQGVEVSDHAPIWVELEPFDIEL